MLRAQGTKRSLRELAQPKHDSAFEQKTRIVASRETWGSSQNNFCSYNWRQRQSRAQTESFGTYSTSFWKVCVFFSVKSPKSFPKVCTKIIKTLAHNTKRRRPRFQKKSKAVFISIRYRKTSQMQDLKSQSTKHSLLKLAQGKRDSAFEQKTRIVQSRETSGSSQNNFYSYNQRNKPRNAQKDNSATYSTSFWKVCVFPSVKSSKFFRKVCTKFIKTIAHNTKRRRPRIRKNQKLFL